MIRHLALVLFVALFSLAGCTTIPATGKKALILISPSQEIALGQQAAPQFVKDYGGEIPDPAVVQYVNNLGHRLAQVSERPELPWEFHPVNSPELNAFALPGGKIFVTRGLLSKMQNEAQLAGVLGHEIGHVTAMHIGQQMTQQMAMQGLVTGLGAAAEVSNNDYLKVLGVGAQAGGSLYLLKFSRDDESQADELGVRYMSKLGYNPVAQIQVMDILKAAEGSGASLEMLSTHPLPQTRIQRLTQLIKQQYPQYAADPPVYKLDATSYQQNVLSRLSQLPPAPPPKPAAGQGGQALRGRSSRK